MADNTISSDGRALIQMGANVNFLMGCIDKIHDSLCPGKCGTWQMRAEQAVTAAKLISSNSINNKAISEFK